MKHLLKEYEIPNICTVTTTEFDKPLLKQVVEIERLVQPHDSWNEQTVTDLLSQAHNKCWAVLNSSHINTNVEEVIAYCIYSQVFEVAEILRIGTHPKYQRQGFAKRLLMAFIKHMSNKKLERVLLEVRADNTTAIALYQQMGFAVIHKRLDYYSAKDSAKDDRCDALIMQFEIK